MHQNKSTKKVGMLNVIYSQIVVAFSKVTSFCYYTYLFLKAYFKYLWQSVKNIYAYMEWGSIWNGIKLMFASTLVCWKLASDEIKLLKQQHQRTAEENIALGAPEGFFQQARYNLILANT